MRPNHIVMLVIVVSTIALAISGYFFLSTRATLTPVTKSPPDELTNSMRFVVRIPENTPKEDRIFFFSKFDLHGRVMEQIASDTYSFVLDADEFGLKSGDEINYRYTRNRVNFAEAEFLRGTPEVNDYFYETGEYEENGVGRSVQFEPGKVQQDTIERWRWFPEGEMVLEDISELLPQGDFLSRVDDIRFRSGQGIWDLYTPEFDPFNTPTAERMKRMGYEWAVLYPPWQWISEDPMPKAGDINTIAPNSAPNYTDEQLIEQIQAFQAKGIKVIISPQINHANTNDRSIEWWQEYWREMERLFVHYAKLAEQTGADAFAPHFMLTGLSRSYTEDIVALEQTTWEDIFSNLRSVFSGEIGQLMMVWNIDQGLSPDLDFITWGDQVDFFVVFTNAVLSETSRPTQTELISAASTILDQTKEIYDTFHAPVMLSLGTHSIKESWRTTYSYPLGTCGEEKSDLECPYEFSAYDQARVTHAFFEALRTRPWVMGMVQFGYGLWEMPLIREWNIRGKTAERVWHAWNNFIYSLPM